MHGILKIMIIWDYKLKKGWKPQTDLEWRWYLERKINYDDWKGLEVEKLKKFLARIKIPESKRLLLKIFLKQYGKKV